MIILIEHTARPKNHGRKEQNSWEEKTRRGVYLEDGPLIITNYLCSASRAQAPLQVMCPGHVWSLALGLEVELTDENSPCVRARAQS
jgi:hypothetical protein